MPTSMTPSSPWDEQSPHPDLAEFGRTALATFDAAVTGRMWHPADLHPDLAAFCQTNTPYSRFGIMADFVTRQVAAGWPLDTVLDEVNRRLRVIHDRQGGAR